MRVCFSSTRKSQSKDHQVETSDPILTLFSLEVSTILPFDIKMFSITHSSKTITGRVIQTSLLNEWAQKVGKKPRKKSGSMAQAGPILGMALRNQVSISKVYILVFWLESWQEHTYCCITEKIFFSHNYRVLYIQKFLY